MHVDNQLLGVAPAARSRPAVRWAALESYADYLTIGALLAGLVAIGLLLGQFTSFFSIDGDIKYLSAWSIAHHWNNAAIAYPFARMDSAGHYVLPLTAWVHGHDYAGYSLPFEYLTAFCLAIFGNAGLVVPPVLGTGLLLLVQLQMATLLGIRGRRTVLLIATVACTPVLFYSVTFWEHSLGVALVMGGVALLLRLISMQPQYVPRSSALLVFEGDGTGHATSSGNRGELLALWPAVGAGCLFAAAVMMRRETVIVAVVSIAVLAILFPSRRIVLALGTAFVVMCVPLGLIYELQPQPLALGLTHSSSGRAGVTSGSYTHFHRLSWLTHGSWATALFVLCTASLALVRRLRPRLLPAAFVVASLAVGIGFVVQLFSHFSWTDLNPMAFCPLAVWGVWSLLLLKRDGFQRMELAVWAVMLVSTVAIVYEAYDYGDSQWGPRYLLFAFPLLILLAIRARQDLRDRVSTPGQTRLVEYGFIGLFSISVLLQCVGITLAASDKAHLNADMNAISRLPASVIVAGDGSVPQLAPLAANDTLLFAMPHQYSLRHLMSLVARDGVTAVTMTCAANLPKKHCHWDGYAGWTHTEVHKGRLIRYVSYSYSASAAIGMSFRVIGSGHKDVRR
jgi:hypothetical protein